MTRARAGARVLDCGELRQKYDISDARAARMRTRDISDAHAARMRTRAHACRAYPSVGTAGGSEVGAGVGLQAAGFGTDGPHRAQG